MTRVFRFGEQYEMSSGVAMDGDLATILLVNLPGAVGVRRATDTEDRSGTDWWVDRTNEHSLSIDMKVREVDWRATHPNEDDLALETWSVVERGIRGWTLDEAKRTDYVLWFWKDTRRWALLPFPMLCEVFREHYEQWTRRYRIREQNTENRYHSQCVFVPRLVVWQAIEDRYSGNEQLELVI